MSSAEQHKIKIASLGDLHINENSHGQFQELFGQISEVADVLVLCGDLTDYGLPIEAEILAEELMFCKVPVFGVEGNHDHQNNQEHEVRKILESRMHFPNSEIFELNGISFVGTKGFGGGFGTHTMTYFGEKTMKGFVNESIQEGENISMQLAKVTTSKAVVALHYSPVKGTVIGESPEIYIGLGSSHLEEAIDRHRKITKLILHGHAHHGSPAGVTLGGIPVKNTAYPLMKKLYNEKKQPYPFGLFEI